MEPNGLLSKCTGFEWDEGNLLRNWEGHGVTGSECEQVFFNNPLIVAPDVKHSEKEDRYYALGQTDMGRLLFVVIIIRKTLVRIISARDMSRKERKAYGQLLKRYLSFLVKVRNESFGKRPIPPNISIGARPNGECLLI